MQSRSQPIHRASRWGLLAGIVTVLATLGLASSAQAAPSTTHLNAISNITLEKESGSDGPLNQWESAKINADWSVPDGASAGDTFGMTLPQEFVRWGTGDFTITDPDTGATMATCTVAQGTGPEVICTLTEAVNGQENVGGSFWMSVQVARSTTEESVEFEVGNELVVVDLPGESGIIPEDLTEAESPYKYSGSTDQDGRFLWTIGVPSIFVKDGAFTIADELDPTQENHRYTGEIQLIQRPVKDGQLTGEWSTVPTSRYTVDWAASMKSFTFNASGLPAEGYSYRLQYTTEAEGVVLEGDVFGNKATVGTTDVSSKHHITANGGGTGSGEQYTRFSITKVLAGSAANNVGDHTYTVRYRVKGSNAPAHDLSLSPGQEVKSDRAPLGSTFIIEEVNLPEAEGITWGEWTLTGEGVKKTEDGTYELTPASTAGVQLVLTNVAEPTEPTQPT
ncbi:Ig-like domain-containing protein, partial [Galactobacter sp.]|uniref:Ig-like domain-containing protein n=1 Tax=Galactobacter sp. TaxID=2676125 RepID=UPI0025BBD50D